MVPATMLAKALFKTWPSPVGKRALLLAVLLALNAFTTLIAHARDTNDAPNPSKHLYLLSKPIVIETQLGPLARTIHYVTPNLSSLVKSSLLYSTTGEPLSALLLFAFESSQALVITRLQSTADLKFRAWYARRNSIRKIKRLPGVERALVLTSAELSYSGLVARKSLAQSFVFVESTAPLDLPPELSAELGAPIEIHDLEATMVRMRLTAGETEAPGVWQTSLAEIFTHAPMPNAISSDWTKAIAQLDAKQKLFNRYVTKEHEQRINIQAKLVFPDGSERDFGTVMQASAVRKLLGQTLFTRIRNAWRAFWGSPALPKGNIPIVKLACEAALTRP